MRMRPQVISLPMEALPVNQPVQASPSNLPSEMHEINLYEGQWEFLVLFPNDWTGRGSYPYLPVVWST